MSLRAEASPVDRRDLERAKRAAERGGPVGLSSTGGGAKRSPLNGAASRSEKAVQP